jgi:hypothetical protein
MYLFKKGDDEYILFAELAKADSSTLIGNSIKAIINSCGSKDDFDWLVAQLKDYLIDAREGLELIVGNKACDLMNVYKPFKNAR